MIINQGGSGITPKEIIEENTIVPGTDNQVLNNGAYLRGDVTVLGDVNLLPENINPDVSIFGVEGAMDVNIKSSDLFTVPVAENVQGQAYVNLGKNDFELTKKIYSASGMITKKIIPIEVLSNQYVVLEHKYQRISTSYYYDIVLHYGVTKNEDGTYTKGIEILLSSSSVYSNFADMIFRENKLYLIYLNREGFPCVDVYNIDSSGKPILARANVLDTLTSRYFYNSYDLGDGYIALSNYNYMFVFYIHGIFANVVLNHTKILEKSQKIIQISPTELLSFSNDSSYFSALSSVGKIQYVYWNGGEFIVTDKTYSPFCQALGNYLPVYSFVALKNENDIDILISTTKAIIRMKFNLASKEIKTVENDFAILPEQFGYTGWGGSDYTTFAKINNLGEYTLIDGYTPKTITLSQGYKIRLTTTKKENFTEIYLGYLLDNTIYFARSIAGEGINTFPFDVTLLAKPLTSYEERIAVSKYTANLGEVVDIYIPKVGGEL